MATVPGLGFGLLSLVQLGLADGCHRLWCHAPIAVRKYSPMADMGIAQKLYAKLDDDPSYLVPWLSACAGSSASSGDATSACMCAASFAHSTCRAACFERRCSSAYNNTYVCGYSLSQSHFMVDSCSPRDKPISHPPNEADAINRSKSQPLSSQRPHHAAVPVRRLLLLLTALCFSLLLHLLSILRAQ